MKKLLSILLVLGVLSSSGVFAASVIQTRNVIATYESSVFDTSFSILAPYTLAETRGGSIQKREKLYSQTENGNVSIRLSENSQSTVNIPLSLAADEHLQLLEASTGNKNGSCLILNASNDVVGYVIVQADDAAATIVDKSTLQITTNESSLVLAASAASFSDYFSSALWGVTNDGLQKLSLIHKNYLFSVTVGDPPQWKEQERQAKRAHSWSLIQSRYKNDYRFSANVAGMQNQYYCHYDTIGSWKDEWNLEPQRPDPGYWGTVGALCNP